MVDSLIYRKYCCKFLPERIPLAEVNCQLAISDFCCSVSFENYQVASAR